jgi:DNA-binding transcriptional regulator YhcF (GntR family)
MIVEPTRSSAPGGTIARADGIAGERIEALVRFGAKALDVPAIRLWMRSGDAEVMVGYPSAEPDDPQGGMERLRARVLARGAPVAIENVRSLPMPHRREETAAGLAWAGVPIRAASGEVIGALWMSDLHPRSWSHRDMEALQELAACVVRELGSPEPPPAKPSGPAGEHGANRRASPPPSMIGRARGRRAADSPGADRREILAWLRRSGRSGEIERGAAGEVLADWLRDCIREGLHAGHLRAGDRLPSIREIALALGATTYAVADAYERLEGLGLVNKRDRSGIYVAPPAPEPDRPVSETVEWMVAVLGEAVEHRLKIPQLPDLIRRWTVGRDLRTRAARDQLGSRADFRLVARPSPTFSPAFARSLLTVISSLNLQLPTGP